MSNGYKLRMRLTGFLGASVRVLEDEMGTPKKYICIPCDDNFLKINDSHDVYATVIMQMMKKPNFYGNTHYLRLYCSKRQSELLSSKGYSAPFVGDAVGLSSEKAPQAEKGSGNALRYNGDE